MLFADAGSISLNQPTPQLVLKPSVAEAVKRQALLNCSVHVRPRTCQCNLVSHLSLAHSLYPVSIPGVSPAGTRPPFQMSRDLLTAKLVFGSQATPKDALSCLRGLSSCVLPSRFPGFAPLLCGEEGSRSSREQVLEGGF